MKKIFIVGGDGFARECYYMLIESSEYGKSVEFGGFLGHGGYGHTVDYKSFQHLYRGEVADHVFTDNEYAVIGAGYPELRRKIYDDLKKNNIRLYTLIARGVNLSSFVEYGEGNFFGRPFVSTVDIKIGDCNVFNGDVIVGHDVEIGDFNFFGPRSQALGEVKVGNMNTIGANTILMPNSKIGNNNKIAPLSAVYKGCNSNGYYVGNPALKVGDIEDV